MAAAGWPDPVLWHGIHTGCQDSPDLLIKHSVFAISPIPGWGVLEGRIQVAGRPHSEKKNDIMAPRPARPKKKDCHHAAGGSPGACGIVFFYLGQIQKNYDIMTWPARRGHDVILFFLPGPAPGPGCLFFFPLGAGRGLGPDPPDAPTRGGGKTVLTLGF